MKLNFHNFIVRRRQWKTERRMAASIWMTNGRSEKREKKNEWNNYNDALAPHQTPVYENALHNIAIGKTNKNL